MHYSLGYENDVSRLKMIDLIFDKIAAASLGNKVYFKVIMAVLSHGMLAHALYVAVSVIEKIALCVYVFVFHKTPRKNSLFASVVSILAQKIKKVKKISLISQIF